MHAPCYEAHKIVQNWLPSRIRRVEQRYIWRQEKVGGSWRVLEVGVEDWRLGFSGLEVKLES